MASPRIQDLLNSLATKLGDLTHTGTSTKLFSQKPEVGIARDSPTRHFTPPYGLVVYDGKDFDGENPVAGKVQIGIQIMVADQTWESGGRQLTGDLQLAAIIDVITEASTDWVGGHFRGGCAVSSHSAPEMDVTDGEPTRGLWTCWVRLEVYGG